MPGLRAIPPQGATVWLAQQWNIGTRFALLGKPDSATRRSVGKLKIADR